MPQKAALSTQKVNQQLKETRSWCLHYACYVNRGKLVRVSSEELVESIGELAFLKIQNAKSDTAVMFEEEYLDVVFYLVSVCLLKTTAVLEWPDL